MYFTAEVGPEKITVIQHLTNGDYLVELSENQLAEDLIENGFALDELHVQCNPRRGYYINVSVMGLRAYVDNQALIAALAPYGIIKGEVIRLKYKADHDLAGLENGNRLVRMILSKPSIPYSLKIGEEWCRIIHNNQQSTCRECQQLGHSRRKFPSVICNLCKQTGHISMDCPQRFTFPPPLPMQPQPRTKLLLPLQKWNKLSIPHQNDNHLLKQHRRLWTLQLLLKPKIMLPTLLSLLSPPLDLTIHPWTSLYL